MVLAVLLLVVVLVLLLMLLLLLPLTSLLQLAGRHVHGAGPVLGAEAGPD